MSDARDSLPPLASLYSHAAAAAALNEAMALLGDGIAASAIESAALDAAMPTGVLAIIDAVSLEVIDHQLHEAMHDHEHEHKHEQAHADHGGHEHEREHAHDHQHEHGHAHEHHGKHEHDHSHDHAGEHSPSHEHDHDHAAAHDHAHDHAHAKPAHSDKPGASRLTESAVYVLEKMAHGYSRMGKAAGAGFYDYNETPPQLWSGLKTFERRNRGIPAQDITDRLTHAAMLAALSSDDPTGSELIAASLGPKIAASAAQALDMLPAPDRHRFIDRCRALASIYGPRFEPSPATLTRLNRT